jgi:hypothetical protein
MSVDASAILEVSDAPEPFSYQDPFSEDNQHHR